MKTVRLLLVACLLAGGLSDAQAGIFFNRKPKANPSEQVPQLVNQLRSDPSERNRAKAAEELRKLDAGQFPEILPALVAAATTDPSGDVRMEAIGTLSRIRPVSAQAGQAIEQGTRDSSKRVQVYAHRVLLQYRIAGYRSSMPDTANGEGCQVCKPDYVPSNERLAPMPASLPAALPAAAPTRSTNEPPLAVMPSAPSPMPRVTTPLPGYPTTPGARSISAKPMTQDHPTPTQAPPTIVFEEGPSLGPDLD